MNIPANPKARRSAFTLIEMVLVLAIVALLVGAAAVSLPGVIGTGREKVAKSDVLKIMSALRNYEIDNKYLPTEAQGLKSLVEEPTSQPRPKRWKKYMNKLPTDPWGSDYRYRRPGKQSGEDFDVFSPGKDLQPDTEDDIGNWGD